MVSQVKTDRYKLISHSQSLKCDPTNLLQGCQYVQSGMTKCVPTNLLQGCQYVQSGMTKCDPTNLLQGCQYVYM